MPEPTLFQDVARGKDAEEAYANLRAASSGKFNDELEEFSSLNLEHPGAIVREIRKSFGVNQSELATYFEFSQALVSSFERGDLSENSKFYQGDIKATIERLIRDQTDHPNEMVKYDYYLKELDRALNGLPTRRSIERWVERSKGDGRFVGDPVRYTELPDANEQAEGKPFLFSGYKVALD